MKHLKLFESYIEDHISDRGIDLSKIKPIIDEQSGDVFFFLYNLSGQIVGYQKYNPNYEKKGQRLAADPRLVKYYNWITDEDKGKMIELFGD